MIRLHAVPPTFGRADRKALLLHIYVDHRVIRSSYRLRRRFYPPHIARAVTLASYAGLAWRVEVEP